MELSKEELARSLAGDTCALARVVDVLTPVVQARVARRLLSRRVGPAKNRDARQEVEDLTQEVFLALFADAGKVLRSWDPEQGLSLANFVGLVAERQAVSILRSGKRSPWKEDPTLTEKLDSEAPDAGPEASAASREQLRLLLEGLREQLSPLGWELFDLLYLRELSVSEVVGRTGMSSDAVYAWRSRLQRLARRLFQDLSEMPAPRRRTLTEGQHV